jgi:NADH:ubiquinone oxidoreductase subunit E
MEKLDANITAYIDDCMEHHYSNSYLISVLHKIQGKYGYLSETHMNDVAERMQIPASTVGGVATFYHFFRLKPRGKYAISLCLGTACFVKGADKVLDAFRTELGIGLGETTQDRLFSLESSRCIGVCALAPVVMINEKVYSRVSPNQVPTMVSDLRAEQ